MSAHSFKNITVVPPYKDFVDIVLSKTQRKTPTVIHKHYAIGRIRSFYIRKVKFTSQSFFDKITTIITDFPILSDLHPFYAEWISKLYDRDHYKLALGQLNKAKLIIVNCAKHYSKLLKYGDSLYRCKQLKRASMGLMVKCIKNQSKNLDYLEQVRQHMSRLPSIDPTTRTLLLCGYPNVGKSSFLNKVTRADVDVQPYPFTTKSLFVGHLDYRYLRWQVIDTPGILDRPVEEMGVIEMMAVNALAHLRAAVLFFIDVSEQCGYSVSQQLSLFESIRPLLANKVLVICANKIDVKGGISELAAEDKERLAALQAESPPVGVMETSNLTEAGIMEVRNAVCDQLLEQRVETKLRSRGAQQLADKLYVAQPVVRDAKSRPANIPESVRLRLEKRRARKAAGPTDADDEDAMDEDKPAARRLERHVAEELGDDYVTDLRKNWDLANDDWKYDVIPEIWEGHNVLDFFDTEIEARLNALDAEEQKREEAGFYASSDEENGGLEPSELKHVRHTAGLIREKKGIMKIEARERKRPGSHMPRTGKRIRTDSVHDGMAELGVDVAPEDAGHLRKARSRSVKRDSGAAKRRAVDTAAAVASRERSRSRSAPPRSQSGVRDSAMAEKVRDMGKKAVRKRNQLCKKGEADRHIGCKMPKHLFSGKSGLGTSSHR